MNVLPANQQESLLLDHKTHGAADVAAAHAVGQTNTGVPWAPRRSILASPSPKTWTWASQVVVDKDDHAQAIGTQYGDHAVI
jgi:hypothetical protein